MSASIESQAFRLDEDGLCNQLSIAPTPRLRDLANCYATVRR